MEKQPEKNSKELEKVEKENKEVSKESKNKDEEKIQEKSKIEEKNEEKDKKEEVKETKKDLEKDLEDLNDRYKRLYAEFENYKKRTQKESTNRYAELTGDIVSNVLPVLDNLEKAAETKTKDESYKDGIKMVIKQFKDVLEKLGMVEIETVGKRFDPEYHEAVSHIDDPEKGEQEIVKEYRKGYKIGDKVIRHSMVIVAN